MKQLLLLSLWISASAFSAIDVSSFRKTLAAMVAADTSNPPGNEARIVKIVAERLKAAGVPYEIVEFAPGRQNIVARLKGDGTEKPLLLLAHLDVVGTQDQKWSSEPHVMTEVGGFLVGRGVGDDLGMATMALETFLKLKRDNTPLRRDVILALTGDEETGGRGIRHILEHRPELLIDAGIALNEGGGPILGDDGKVKYVGLQSSEKTYEDFTLTAKGPTGHSSVPLEDNSIYRLSRALDKLSKDRMPARLIPVTRRYFERRAALEPPKMAAAMRALVAAKGALPASALKIVESDPVESANLRTTCVATMLHGGTKENALPPSAQANVNCRILPDETSEAIAKRLATIIGDPLIEIKTVGDFGVAGSSPTEGEIPAAIEKLTRERWPKAPVIPTMARGATDSRFLRMKGIASYGFNALAISEADSRRAHGIDERIAIASIEPGLDAFLRVVLDLAARRGGG